MYVFCLHVYMCIPLACLVSSEVRGWFFETGVRHGYEWPCGCWGLNQGPQQVLLSAEPSSIISPDPSFHIVTNFEISTYFCLALQLPPLHFKDSLYINNLSPLSIVKDIGITHLILLLFLLLGCNKLIVVQSVRAWIG